MIKNLICFRINFYNYILNDILIWLTDNIHFFSIIKRHSYELHSLFVL